MNAKKVLTLCLTALMIFGLTSVALADTFSDSWGLNPSALTKNWGYKKFPHTLEVTETGNYSGNYLVLNNHLVEVFWYPQHYAASELWYNVGVNASYKNGGSTVGSIGVNNWSKRTLYLPVGKTHNGGYNYTSFSLDRRYVTINGEYQTLVSAPDLYWPLTTNETLVF